MGQSARRWKFGWCEYVEISRTLFVRGERSELRGKPLDVLKLLLEHPQYVIPNTTLIKEVWGNASRQSLSVAISKLRKAFGEGLEDLIQNVASEGYQMAVHVQCTITDEPISTLLQLQPGQEIPGGAGWKAALRLGGPDNGPVWLAQNEQTGERRVFKFATDGIRLRTLQREEAVAEIFAHSNGPQLFLRHLDDWNFSTNPYYIAGEYVGPDLQGFLGTDEFKALAREDRIRLVVKLANAVAGAHAMGVLHNDLKPGNVLIRRDASSEDLAGSDRYTMVLIDFGDSSFLQDTLGTLRPGEKERGDAVEDAAGNSTTVGPGIYRAPETTVTGIGSVEADVYALGIILYQIVVGDLQLAPIAEWQQDIADPLLAEVIACAANKNPQRRFRSVAALAEDLSSLERRRTKAAEEERNAQRVLQAQRDLDRIRIIRPWVAAAIIFLAAGVVVSAGFYRSAMKERNWAQRENRSLEAMLSFLTDDVLAQSNLSSVHAKSSNTVNLTLSAAISTAVPQIDRRFSEDPLIAAKLHETIADSMRARTQFVEADQEYRIAADRYRAAEGSSSEAAIAVELKRDATRLVGLLPGEVEKARENFDQQSRLIKLLPHPKPVVLVLRDFVDSGFLGLKKDPSKAVPVLQRAVHLAETTPGFDPLLLQWMKGRYCGLYVRMQDGPRLEAAAEERIQEISRRYGQDAPMLVSYEMYLQEAYYLQDDFKKAVQQADRNYPRFKKLVGERSQYTLAVLANRAASLSRLGRYAEAMEDDLLLYKLEGNDPSGVRMRIGSLHDAALFACRAGNFREGLEEARQVLHEAGPGSTSMPAFYNGAKFIEAECLLGQMENSARPNTANLRTAETLLAEVDTEEITRQTGESEYGPLVDLAQARACLLRHEYSSAAKKVAKVESYFAKPGGDPYETQQYRRVKAELDTGDHGPPTSAKTYSARQQSGELASLSLAAETTVVSDQNSF